VYKRRLVRHTATPPRGIADYFGKNKWLLITPEQLREFVENLAFKGWEDDVVTMTVKLLRK